MQDTKRVYWLLAWLSLLLMSSVLIISALSYSEMLKVLHRNLFNTQLLDAIQDNLQQLFVVNLGLTLGVIAIGLFVFGQLLIRHHRQLKRLATYDSLTGCLNRQAFDAVFRTLQRSTLRYQRPLSALLIDIDHFKQINDQHGHLSGDHVLKETASLIDRMQRKSDVIARWGGEEFFVLLPECSLNDAMRLAEQIRLRIRSHHFGLYPAHVVTLSIGVAQYDNMESADDLFRRLDKALYAAKSQGRNRVEKACDPYPQHNKTDATLSAIDTDFE